ncbi:dephospho-CoA kinase [Salininema proteolyticum]|uniref:Dephospho-CoA kinase n=1 Tax=Salininema proteolyticum TaxID=1607685 RepID=A0ABV8U2H0_9ACTN
MLKIALTGGIGAGKSTAARIFSQLGAELIDADVLAREVVAPGTDGLRAIVDRFGPEVLAANGELDRTKLASIVFDDGASRARLESIVHPRVRARSEEIKAALPGGAVVLEDIPLLAETGQAAAFHLAVAVEAPVEVRFDRLVERGMSREDAVRRVKSQASEEERRRVCDVVLDNSGDEHSLELQIQQLWRERVLPFARNLSEGKSAKRGEKLEFIAHDKRWESRFEHIAARLRRVLGTSAVRIDHIGSTAVADLPAKDVIDIQVTVVALTAVDRAEASLGAAGFFSCAPEGGKAVYDVPNAVHPEEWKWEKRLYGSADPGNIAHLHFRSIKTPGQRFALLFRDWMRSDEEAREDYARMKGDLAARFETTTEYAEAKNPWFTGEATDRAEAWAEETGWRNPLC